MITNIVVKDKNTIQTKNKRSKNGDRKSIWYSSFSTFTIRYSSSIIIELPTTVCYWWIPHLIIEDDARCQFCVQVERNHVYWQLLIRGQIERQETS
ncbi:hypothetical protein NPIL_402871 [Nephila pilipes]|uniref:Uncharacterized protein n=1 Tax=Nephila pilipes TaxID=299642 RepID=A0A8X6UP18_NEPPI|nr:hypothetical protein NPIL_402871 [Nephila pilipes]